MPRRKPIVRPNEGQKARIGRKDNRLSRGTLLSTEPIRSGLIGVCKELPTLTVSEKWGHFSKMKRVKKHKSAKSVLREFIKELDRIENYLTAAATAFPQKDHLARAYLSATIQTYSYFEKMLFGLLVA